MSFDASVYERWLNLPAGQVPPDDYALLGLPRFEADAARIRSAADGSLARLRALPAAAEGDSERLGLIQAIEAARDRLLDPKQRLLYNATLAPAAAARRSENDTAVPVVSSTLSAFRKAAPVLPPSALPSSALPTSALPTSALPAATRGLAPAAGSASRPFPLPLAPRSVGPHGVAGGSSPAGGRRSPYHVEIVLGVVALVLLVALLVGVVVWKPHGGAEPDRSEMADRTEDTNWANGAGNEASANSANGSGVNASRQDLDAILREHAGRVNLLDARRDVVVIPQWDELRSEDLKDEVVVGVPDFDPEARDHRTLDVGEILKDLEAYLADASAKDRPRATAIVRQLKALGNLKAFISYLDGLVEADWHRWVIPFKELPLPFSEPPAHEIVKLVATMRFEAELANYLRAFPHARVRKLPRPAVKASVTLDLSKVSFEYGQPLIQGSAAVLFQPAVPWTQKAQEADPEFVWPTRKDPPVETPAVPWKDGKPPEVAAGDDLCRTWQERAKPGALPPDAPFAEARFALRHGDFANVEEFLDLIEILYGRALWTEKVRMGEELRVLRPQGEHAARAARMLLGFLDRAWTIGRDEDAKSLARAALEMAAAANDPTLLREAELWRKFLDAYGKLVERAQQADAALAERYPGAGRQHYDRGVALCLLQGEWNCGMFELAQGDSAVAARLARLDQSAPVEGKVHLELAEAWQAAAENSPFPDSELFRSRAHYWFQRAIRFADPIGRRKASQAAQEALRMTRALALRGTDFIPQIPPDGMDWEKVQMRNYGSVRIDFPETQPYPFAPSLDGWLGGLSVTCSDGYPLLPNTIDSPLFPPPKQRSDRWLDRNNGDALWLFDTRSRKSVFELRFGRDISPGSVNFRFTSRFGGRLHVRTDGRYWSINLFGGGKSHAHAPRVPNSLTRAESIALAADDPSMFYHWLFDSQPLRSPETTYFRSIHWDGQRLKVKDDLFSRYPSGGAGTERTWLTLDRDPNIGPLITIFAPDGKALLVHSPGAVHLHRLEEGGTRSLKLDHRSEIPRFNPWYFSPDCRWLVLAARAKSLTFVRLSFPQSASAAGK